MLTAACQPGDLIRGPVEPSDGVKVEMVTAVRTAPATRTATPETAATRPPATAAATTAPFVNSPIGFPVAETLRPMQVVETAQGKGVAGASPNGPTIAEVARSIQTRTTNDAEANRYGWNCRTHAKHEGLPAVDWYLPTGTPVVATMRGEAELHFITTTNAFDYYGADPRLTLGLPSPSTPLYPLPGPGGGMGVFVSILNGNIRAEYGHLEPARTVANVPAAAFVAPYSRTYDYAGRFAPLREHNQSTLVAKWTVEKGDVIGFVGNVGYSEVPHLHYQVVTPDRQQKFCPTQEALPNSGWLFGRPG